MQWHCLWSWKDVSQFYSISLSTDGSAAFSPTEWPKYGFMDHSAERSVSSCQLCSYCMYMSLSTHPHPPPPPPPPPPPLSHLGSQIPYMLMTWLHGPLPNTPPQPHMSCKRPSTEWAPGQMSGAWKSTAVKHKQHSKVMLNLENMPVPQVDKLTFLGVTLNMRLTWKTHLEAVVVRSVRKLGLLQKLAGTIWGADTNIMWRVYTGAGCPIMEYATTSWVTTLNANKSKLDRVQNFALEAIVGAMKTTPIKEMEKTADLEPLELRRTFKVLTQTEKIQRLLGHPLHKELAAPTKKRLKRHRLNH